MFWIITLIVVLIIWPVWLFIKLARYGQGILRPNFERMNRKIDEYTGFPVNSFFAYNRIGGKIIYYTTMLWVFLLFLILIYITIYSLAK